MHDLLYYVFTTQSHIIFSHHIFTLFALYYPPPHFSLVTTILLAVYMKFCLFFFFVHLCFQFYIPDMSKIIWFINIFFWLKSFSMIVSCCCKWQHFIFFYVFRCMYVPHVVYTVTCQRTLGLFPWLGCYEQCRNEQKSAFIFANVFVFCFYFFILGDTQQRYCWVIW